MTGKTGVRPHADNLTSSELNESYRLENMMSTDRDPGRVAVITGASSGIGEATARALAGGGYRLALLARRTDRVESLAAELGNGALPIEADVTDRDSIVA